MKLHISFISALLFISIITSAQTSVNNKSNYTYYWDKVDTLELAGLPRTALVKVDKIYEKSLAENNTEQLIKSLVFKMKFSYAFEADNYAKQILSLEKDLEKLDFPNSAVVHSMLGEMYWIYFKQNRYRYYNRSKITEFEPNDLKTWSLNQIYEKSREHYLVSLQNEKSLYVLSTDSLLNDDIKPGYPENFQVKNMYDFLAFRAIDFLKSDELSLKDFTPSFKMDDERFFSSAEEYLELDLHSSSSPSNTVLAFRIFQDLLNKHQHEKNFRDYLLIDIHRLNFAKQKSINNKKNELYITALQGLMLNSSEQKDLQSEVKFQLAKAIYERGNKYERKTSDKYRWDFKTALTICAEIIEKNEKVDPWTIENCEALQSNIKSKSIAVRTEDIFIPKEATPALISYRNIDSVYVRIFKTTYKDFDAIQKDLNERINRRVYQSYQKLLSDTLQQFKPYKQLSFKLPQTSDYRQHSLEAILPELDAGQYIYVFSANSSFNYYENAIVINFKSVSNISFIKRTDKKGMHEFVLLHRKTGSPLANIETKPYLINYDYRNREETISPLTMHKTNNSGFVKIESGNTRSRLIAEFKNGNDNLSTKNYHTQRDQGMHSYHNRSREQWETQTVFFTDRAIFRPGQTIFFKAIVYQTDFEKNHEILPDYSTTVTLYDVNNQAISELEVTTNKYGTFSGSFTVPKGVLSGRMSIRENNGRKSVRVEEYKRPTFEVTMNKTEGTPKLGEKVTASGVARAFSGAPIDGAKVKYTIYRNAKFQGWNYRHRWNSPEYITNGEVLTNENGEFKVDFTALPQSTDTPEMQAHYNFEIKVDITDKNGETRSASKTIQIAYTALLLSTQISELVEKEKFDSLVISTTNLEGVFESAKGNITIYKLKSPNQLFRNRHWEMPDTFMYSEDEFWAKLPHNQYAEENNFLNWKREKTIFNIDFNTGISKSIILEKAEKLASGKYLVALTANDKFGTEVKSKSYFTLYSSKEKNAPIKTIDFFYLEKQKANPGETVELLAGTSEKEINVLFELEQNGKILEKKQLKIKNRLEKISIPIKEEYSGNINLNYVFVKEGRLYNHSKTINVPYPQNKINFKFETFRNKLIPGEKEQWRIKLSGNEGEKIAAEMLATLYDASLDEFAKNPFDFNLNKFWHPQLKWQNFYNFGATSGIHVSELWNKQNSTKNIELNNLNWFGFNYHYTPQFSERGLHNLKNGSVVLVSSKKRGKTVLSGTVRSVHHEVLPGVSVIIKGTNIGTITDIDGKFQLKTSQKKASIQVSSIGMKTYEFDVSGTSVVDVMLAYDNNDLDEVVVVGYGNQQKKELTGSSMRIRGASSLPGVAMSMNEVAQDDAMQFDEVMPITRESEIKPPPPPTNSTMSFENISSRKNLQETAFFYPHLHTNSEGEIVINFTIPEALTKWKMLGFAHSEDLKYGLIEKELITSKDLMVVPNLPRFIREGDQLTLTSKVVNLSDKKLDGTSKLMLFNALTMQPIDSRFENINAENTFQVEPGQSTLVSWTIKVPENVEAVSCRIAAQSGNFTDGEEKVIPVLSNRMLVSETMPLYIREGQEKTFILDKLANTQSDTRKNHSLTLEFTANPAWYAIQALPYLMEFPHECMEQTFSRYYANTIATSIINSNPKIRQVFEAWKMQDDGSAFSSKLEQNQELKQVLLQETPWVLDAKNETEQNKRIALLFDLNKMSHEQNSALRKLKEGQYPSGGWAWFKGGRESRYITQHIVSGFGHMRKMGILEINENTQLWQMLKKALKYLDSEIVKDYKQILKEPEKHKRISHTTIHYLYVRSFFKDIPISEDLTEAIHYFKSKTETSWQLQNNYMKGMIALALFRDGDQNIPHKIVKSLKEHATQSDELGMYWKLKWGYYWHQAPVETQALMIELFNEVANDKKAVDDLRVWLLKNKQTNSWKTTKATAEACYALLLDGNDWLATESKVQFEIGRKKFSPQEDETVNTQAGTGYFKKVWESNEVTPEMATLKITKHDNGISWGGLHWQYFEQLDKITSAETPLKIEKRLFREVQSEAGKTIEQLDSTNQLNVGDKVIVKIVVRSDRDMEFIHLKDMRASCFEPIDVLSGYKFQDGLGYYQSTKDASTNFFIDFLRKGTYVLEYPLWVSHTGNFSNGITTIQSMYAPEFSSHSEGVRVKVEKE